MSLFHTPRHIQVSEISLNVYQLDTMVSFYVEQLGLTLLSSTEDEAVVGVTNRPIIRLYRIARPLRTRSAGLYHLAILVPTRQELANFFAHAMTRQLLDGAADHGVSEALYLTDPEGNGIEVYVDRPREQWPLSKGQLQMVSDPLKSKELRQLASGVFTRFSDDTRVGHLHLHVMNLTQSERFYEKLGFDVMQHFGNSSAFLGHLGYHHHIGMNTWLGAGISPRDQASLGLRSVTLVFAEIDFAKLVSLSVTQISDHHYEMLDPNGIPLRLLKVA